MHRILIVILTLLLLFDGCTHPNKKVANSKGLHDDYNVKIKIPSEWIEKIHHFDYTRNTKALILEFENFIKPDTLADPHAQHVDKGYGRVLDPMFVDLDGAPGEELVCLIGWDIISPRLCVFKQIEDNWYLIYFEPINTFYDAPTLSVANNFSPNKTFYFSHVDNHGSGVYADGYSFYKLINNKVYKCLDLVNEAHIIGWGLYMNQSIKMNFEFSGDDSDGLNVDYSYDFSHTELKKGQQPWESGEDISVINDDGRVYYQWDIKSRTYILNIEPYQNGIEDLTAQKIACFGDFGNDTLFVSAFRDQLNQKLKTGTPQQKRILKDYLDRVRKEKIKFLMIHPHPR